MPYHHFPNTMCGDFQGQLSAKMIENIESLDFKTTRTGTATLQISNWILHVRKCLQDPSRSLQGTGVKLRKKFALEI
jgi:hypothetical protein